MKKLYPFIIMMAAALVACDPVQPDTKPDEGQKPAVEGKITLSVDREIIMANNEYAANLLVTVMDSLGVAHDVTADVELYCDGQMDPLTSSEFKTETEGEFSFYAVNGFDISNTVTVRAVKGAKPIPADCDTSGTVFRHRMLLLQHTGTECPNCPRLMTELRYLSEDEKYNGLYQHVALHSYNASDPAYSAAAATLSKSFDVNTYPWLTYNLTSKSELNFDNIRNTIDGLYQESAAAGVSAAVGLSGNYITVNASLKAGKGGKYRLAAWLLEDGIRGAQSGAQAQWQNMHENCLRKMIGTNKTEFVYGKNLGEFKAGEIKDLLMVFDLEEQWKGQNCKVLLIAVDAETYELITCSVCPVDGSINYEYL